MIIWKLKWKLKIEIWYLKLVHFNYQCTNFSYEHILQKKEKMFNQKLWLKNRFKPYFTKVLSLEKILIIPSEWSGLYELPYLNCSKIIILLQQSEKCYYTKCYYILILLYFGNVAVKILTDTSKSYIFLIEFLINS